MVRPPGQHSSNALLASVAFIAVGTWVVLGPVGEGTNAVARSSHTYIACDNWHDGYDDVKFREHPRRCVIAPPSAPVSKSAALAHLRWRHWGSKVARARGIERGLHFPVKHVHVRVKAFGRVRRRCSESDFAYRRVRIKSRKGSKTVRVNKLAWTCA